MQAVVHNDLEGVAMLLSAGAGPNIGNELDINPQFLARLGDKAEIIAILEEGLRASRPR